VVKGVPPFAAVQGPRVTLRPFHEAEFPQVWAASLRRGSGPGPQGARAAERLRQRIRRSGRLTRGTLDLAIEEQGRLIGDIQARHPMHAIPPGVFELGIEIYNRDDHGHGYGSDAVRLLTDWLFTRAGAERVQAGTAMRNAGMRRVFERLGFTFEGEMRGFMAGPSGREDFALYGVTKPEWESRPGP
jgi:RimJ/RimL family protein N-acetyltransferase